MVSLDVNIRFAHERDIDAITSIYEQAVLLGKRDASKNAAGFCF